MHLRDEDALQRASRERRPCAEFELKHHERLESCQCFVHCDTLWGTAKLVDVPTTQLDGAERRGEGAHRAGRQWERAEVSQLRTVLRGERDDVACARFRDIIQAQ